MPRTSERATTALAQIECQRRGWELHITTWTERYPRPGGAMSAVRRDLLGFADGLVLNPGETIAIQWTDHTHVSSRVAKIRISRLAQLAMDAGWTILVWGFDTRTGALKQEVRGMGKPAREPQKWPCTRHTKIDCPECHVKEAP